jgi:hypothetical protein
MIRFLSDCDTTRKVSHRHQRCDLELRSPSEPRRIRGRSPHTRSERCTARTACRSTQRRADGVRRLPWLARSGKRTTPLWGGRRRTCAFKKAIYQFRRFHHPLDNTPSTRENGDQDDNVAEFRIQGRRVREAVGPNNEHHGLLHRP